MIKDTGQSNALIVKNKSGQRAFISAGFLQSLIPNRATWGERDGGPNIRHKTTLALM